MLTPGTTVITFLPKYASLNHRVLLQPDIRRRKFNAAVAKHNRLMSEAMNAEGCDRHLFGLKILAQERGLPVPELYTDPAWKKR